MKIAIPLPYFHKNGGIERHTYELIENWKTKHEIHLYSHSSLSIEGITFHRISGEKLPEFLRRFWFLFQVWCFLRKEKFDMIINNGCGQSLIQDIIITASVHSAWMASFRRFKMKRFFLNPLHYLTLFVEWFNYRFHRYKKIICVSYFIQKELEAFHKVLPEETVVIHLGVNTVEFSPERRLEFRKVLREKYGLKKENRLLLFAAHEWKRKGLDMVLETLRVLSDEYKLLIVGNPSPRELSSYQTLITKLNLKNKVIIGGLCHNMIEAYSAADVFVFPSTFDAFALVVLEAMSCGLPVITTPTVGASELITHEISGFVLRDFRDISGLIIFVEKLFKDSTYYEKISQNSRKVALEYTWEKVAQKTEKLLLETIRSEIL